MLAFLSSTHHYALVSSICSSGGSKHTQVPPANLPLCQAPPGAPPQHDWLWAMAAGCHALTTLDADIKTANHMECSLCNIAQQLLVELYCAMCDSPCRTFLLLMPSLKTSRTC
jgi:hypothetical protein